MIQSGGLKRGNSGEAQQHPTQEQHNAMKCSPLHHLKSHPTHLEGAVGSLAGVRDYALGTLRSVHDKGEQKNDIRLSLTSKPQRPICRDQSAENIQVGTHFRPNVRPLDSIVLIKMNCDSLDLCTGGRLKSSGICGRVDV